MQEQQEKNVVMWTNQNGNVQLFIPGPRNSKLREKGADRTPLWNLGDLPSNRNRLLNKETVDKC